MVQLIRETYIKRALKERPCMACEYIRELSNMKMLTFSEKRSVALAKANNWHIKKGESYLYQFLEHYGDTYSFFAIPEIHEICIKYNFYPEE